ncbi:MAG: putative methyltransferase [Symbiobacteriaceae bacterium]|jgi:SAM-dependent methyltransferase|nr:putative methyltransferase [Symbiobacteriaceae bacterium]
MSATNRTADETREMVRNRYALTAQNSCCTPAAAEGGAYGGCCSGTISVDDLGRTLGYNDEELAAVPEGANLGLGCGNPQAIASIRPGETVVDLGSGAGFDAFLAARQVGDQGRVIGVDMTPEMLKKARQNARSSGFTNVEFRLGEIEHLPVADQTVDVIISNCVINLSPEKPAVFREAFRVLKPGGRVAVSDMVTSVKLPPDVLADVAMYTGCIAGAASVAELEAMLAEVGFVDIRITPKDSRELLRTWGADSKLEDAVFSAYIQAVRPA